MGGTSAAAAAAASAAAIANAVKACGTIVHVQPDEFIKILSFQKNPLIIRSRGGLLSKTYKYLTTFCSDFEFIYLGSGYILLFEFYNYEPTSIMSVSADGKYMLLNVIGSSSAWRWELKSVS